MQVKDSQRRDFAANQGYFLYLFSAGDLLDLKLTPPVLLIALIKAAFISSARVAAG